MVWPHAIEVHGLATNASFIARLIAGVIDHGLPLIIGECLALGIIWLRVLTAPVARLTPTK